MSPLILGIVIGFIGGLFVGGVISLAWLSLVSNQVKLPW